MYEDYTINGAAPLPHLRNYKELGLEFVADNPTRQFECRKWSKPVSGKVLGRVEERGVPTRVVNPAGEIWVKNWR